MGGTPNPPLDKAKKNATKHDFVGAQDALSVHSLKGLSLAEFEANFVVQRQSFEVLKHLYGSRGFGKRRFVLQFFPTEKISFEKGNQKADI